MNTQLKNIRSNFITLIFIVLVIMLLSNCGGVAKNRLVHTDEKDKFMSVIIDDKEIKDIEYGSKFVDMVKESFKQSFEKVSLQTGYDSPKVGELIVMPQNLGLFSASLEKEAAANSRVKVLTNIDYEIYDISGAGKVEMSAAEALALFPFALAGGLVGVAGETIGVSGAVDSGFNAPLKPWISAANNRTLESMAVDLHNKVVSAPKFKTYAESAKMVNTLPAELLVTVRFSDTGGFFPNNALDAGEDSEVIVTIKNTGKGTGYGANLEVASDNSKIRFDKTTNIGDIQPNETKEIKIPCKAALDIGDGKTSFQFNLKEKRGYDAKKVVMNIPVAKLAKPKLEIVSTEIEDGNIGLAKGNGNHVIESGETVELTAFIRNSGVGPAIGVNLVGSDMTPGVKWVQESTPVGTVAPGQTVKAKLAFSVPRNFEAKGIAASLKIADIRGVDKADKKYAAAFSRKSPDLQYAYNIYSKGAPVKTITNGGEYEVELTLSNKGQIAAKDVVLSVSSAGALRLSRSRIDIGDVKDKASAPAQKMTLSVPRTFTGMQAPLSFEIAQADFPANKSVIQIPVEAKSPKLKYTTNLLSKSGGNSLEQGEQVTLEVQVMNDGELPAEGVKIGIVSQDENLQIQGKKEFFIGTIPPNMPGDIVKYQLFAQRRIKVGEARLGVNITQNEFTPIREQYALNIQEEGATVVDMALEDRPKTIIAKNQAGPKISIKGLDTAASVVEDETYRLAFEVTDLKNIAKITVLVNGKAVALKEAASLAVKAVKSKQIVQDIPLDEDENRIVITAYNSDNLLSKKEFTITRVAEEDVDTPKLIGNGNPNAFAVVIGISKFKNDLPPVTYARRDAETMAKYLSTTLGYSEKKIQTYYDEQADVTTLKTYFAKLRTKIKSGVSDVFVYYSGHGTPDTNTQEPYFVPYDFDGTAPATTGLSANELYKQLADVGAKSVTIVLDSCFSGKSSDGKQLIKGVSAGLLKSKDPFFGVKRGVLLTAATKEQPASWYEKKQHGLFTYYFLQGLQGSADHDKNGVITVDELSRHIQSKVSEQALVLHNREQTPEVKGDGAAVVVRYK